MRKEVNVNAMGINSIDKTNESYEIYAVYI